MSHSTQIRKVEDGLTILSLDSLGDKSLAPLPAPRFSAWATNPAPDPNSDQYEHSNLITFLGICQKLDIDLVPITWESRLKALGEGGQASIQQSHVNAQKSFAFRQLLPNDGDTISEDTWPKALRTLINEAIILRHQMLRIHPSTIQLEGVCWSLCINGDVWPVFIFEKSSDGDLRKCLGASPSSVNFLDTNKLIWRDVAYAVHALHANSKK
jgi:hypothetical protein